MADGKQWFKVWTSILTDPALAYLHNQTVGVWLRLCALTAQHGNRGLLEIPAQQLLVTLHLTKAPQEDVNKIFTELKTLNISCNKEVQKDSVTLVTLQFANWQKYQAYSDSYERVNKFRKAQKKRYSVTDEEKRREEKRRDKKKVLQQQGFDFLKIPDFINLKTWQAYLEMRKSIKKPLKTEHQFNLAISTLQKLQSQGHNPNDVLNQSILNSWQGLFELKKSKNKTGGQQDAFTGTPYKNAAEKYAGVGKIPDKDKSTYNAGVGKIPTTKLDWNSTKIS